MYFGANNLPYDVTQHMVCPSYRRQSPKPYHNASGPHMLGYSYVFTKQLRNGHFHLTGPVYVQCLVRRLCRLRNVSLQTMCIQTQRQHTVRVSNSRRIQTDVLSNRLFDSNPQLDQPCSHSVGSAASCSLPIFVG